jgi:diguanylate cyclase (GGDEF)-like protein
VDESALPGDETSGRGEPSAERGASPLEVANEIALLRREVERQARLLERVSEVSRVALEAGELEELLERIVRYVDEQFALARVAIIWIDVERQEFVLAAHAGRLVGYVAPGTRWPLSAGIVGRAVRTGQPQLALDVHADPDYLEIHDVVVSELAVPIRFRDQTLGAFDLESTTAEAFSAEDVVVFRTFADQLAGAIHLAAINRQLAEANERLREANEALQRLSHLDGLTGIPNRRRFDEALALEWRRALRAGEPLSLLLVDIDCFKPFNDTYGHQQGDDCLRRVAAVLQGSLQRAGDLLARYGGEEFAAVLPAADAAGALAYAEALRAAVEALAIPHQRSTAGAVVTVSAGVATFCPSEGGSPEELLARTDRALYAAKHAGRNRVAGG